MMSCPFPICRTAWASVAFLLSFGLIAPVAAEPYRPASDDTVLETLRPADDPLSRELHALRSAFERRPNDHDAAMALVQRYIEVARITGDPRYAGYAEAVIEPLATAEPVSLGALILRATVRQRRHDFAGAIDDLDRVLSMSPGQPQALLTRSSLHLVQGDYPAAAEDCAALKGLTLSLIVSTCSAGVDALSGGLAAVSIRLAADLAKAPPETPPGIRAWALTTLGEISQRLGHWSSAATHFGNAALIDGDDLYLRSAYIDLLLDRDKATEALALIGDDLRPDALLLRRALAAKALGESGLPDLIDSLNDRFAASAARKDQRHLREEARFRLHLTDQPEAALTLALENWSQQKELWDARLVLETALAAGRPEAAMPTITWLNEQGWQDATLDRLISRLQETAS